MSLNPVDKLAIIFTITFVDFMMIILFLLSSEFLTNDRIIITGICGVFLTFLMCIAYRKKPSTKQNQIISDRQYLTFFVLGVFFGILNLNGMEFGYEIDYQNAEPTAFYYGIPLAIGGFGLFLFFSAMSMVVLVIQMPFIWKKFTEVSRWIPFVAGVAFGFGIMTIYNVILYGIPPLW